MKITTLPKIYRLAAIDLGSNAVRMLAAESVSPNIFRPIKQSRKPLRLGQNVYGKGSITKEQFEEGIKFFRRFREIIYDLEIENYCAFGTSALRDSTNAQEFISVIKDQTDILIEPITGELEAKLVFEAINHFVNFNNEPTLLIDIGGGSLELIYVENNQPKELATFQMGTVRTLNKLSSSGIAVEEQLKAIIESYRKQVKEFFDTKVKHRNFKLIVGSGGNFERLAKIEGYIARTLSDSKVTYKKLCDYNVILSRMTIEERMRYFQLRRDRADVIIPAGFLVEMILNEINGMEVHVPGVGLSSGILLHLMKKIKYQDV